jgi:undecaprenyl-phosphate 4-deoxy-4-formamido-L-arabinose transferase
MSNTLTLPTSAAAAPAAAAAGAPAAARPTVSVVVPVYRSEQSLRPLVERLAAVLPEIASDYELVLVNDGSPDASWEVVRELSARHPWVRGVSLMRNFGQHNALLCGVRAARHEVIVTMDDDLQHPPEEVVHLLRALESGYDVVYGTPEQLSHAGWRNWTSRVAKGAMVRAMGVPAARDLNAFRAFRTRLRSAFADYQSPNLLLDVLLSWGTNRFTAVRVRHEPRRVGESGYTFRKLLNHLAYMLTGFSTAPLRVATVVGFGFTLFGMGVLAYVVVTYFVRGSVPGFPFLASLIAIFSGAQLFALGVIGEYIARIFTRSLERPTYVVAERTEDAA